MPLDFIQSNWQRQYPFRQDQGIIDLNNVEVPTDLVVALRISVHAADYAVYINKIYTSNGNVSVGFAGAAGDLGYANATVTSGNQPVPIKNYSGGIIGNITIGNPTRTIATQTFIFNNSNGLVEPTTVLVLPNPVVTGIIVKGTKYTGDVQFSSSSLAVTTTGTLNLEVLNPAAITSRGDQRAEYLTCNNNVISGINSVVPDKNGNIDIYAIEPLAIAVVSINGINQLQLSTTIEGQTLGLNEVGSGIGNLCKLLNTPPNNITDTYGNLEEASEPEWQSWSQYQ